MQPMINPVPPQPIHLHHQAPPHPWVVLNIPPPPTCTKHSTNFCADGNTNKQLYDATNAKSCLHIKCTRLNYRNEA